MALLPAALMLAMGWSNLDSLAAVWKLALLLSTYLVGAFAWLAFSGRNVRYAGSVLLLSAIICPTGLGFLVNVLVAILGAGLMIAPISRD